MVNGDQTEAPERATQSAPTEQISAPITQSNDAFYMAKASQSTELPAAFQSLKDVQITGLGSDDRSQGKVAGGDQLVQNDKSIKPLDSPLYTKLSTEEQSRAAKEIADEIKDKGLTDRAVRDNLRTRMLQVYLGGDVNSQGNEQKMNNFVKQVNENLPKGTSLKLAQPTDDPDYKKFLAGAADAIDKQPGMKMGAHGQIQLWKTENGQEKMVTKAHYAASITRQPVVKNS